MHREKLKFLIERSTHVYQLYLSDKIYVHALLIKSVNAEMIRFLIKEGHLFEKNQTVNKVLTHFEIWYQQVINQEKSLPELNDPFVFERLPQAIPYPKKAIDQLLNI